MKPVRIVKPFEPLFREQYDRTIDLWGGRGRGGSYHASLYAVGLLRSSEYIRGTVMREVRSDVYDTIFREILDRIDELADMWDYDLHAEFDIHDSAQMMSITHIPTGNSIVGKGFKKSSSKRSGKVKGFANFNLAIIDEFDEVSDRDYADLQATLRTKKGRIRVVRIFNPPNRYHWLWRDDYDLKPSGVDGYFKATPKPHITSIHSTYLDNAANLNRGTIARYERAKATNPHYYYTDVLGLISSGLTGRVYDGWTLADDTFDSIDAEVYYGLDWGQVSPSALVALKWHADKLHVKQMWHQPMRGMRYTEELDRVGVPKDAAIICDSADHGGEIYELHEEGWWRAHGISKAKGVAYRVNRLQSVDVVVHGPSDDVWSEYLNYAWKLDANGNPTDKPDKKHDHAMDAIGYAFLQMVYDLGLETH